MKIAVILNRDAGTLRGGDADAAGEELAGIFGAAGHEVSVTVAAGKDAIAAIERAASQRDNQAIVVGGGDGTVSAAAGIAARTGKALGILPLGTMNFFARSLAIPAGMKPAAEALAKGEVRAVDIGIVNGRTFVHTLALGLHPAMVAEREKGEYGSRYGKMLGSVRAFARVVRNRRRFSVSIKADGRVMERRVAGVVVSNNPLGEGHMPYADRLDAGVLGLYLTGARSLVELARVTAAAALGRAEASPLIENSVTTAAEIRFGRGHPMPTTVDGELVRLAAPLRVEIVAGGLKVLAPPAPPNVPAAR